MKKIISVVIVACSIILIAAGCNNSKKAMQENPGIDGTWELVFIDSAAKPIPEMFPDKVPTVVINTPEKRLSGSTGCNQYSTALNISGSTIDLTAPIIATKMMCMNSAQGENTFLKMLPQVNKFSVSGNELYFMKDAQTLLRFTKKM